MCPDAFVHVSLLAEVLSNKTRKERGKRRVQRSLWQQARARLPTCLKKLNFPMDGRRAAEIYSFAKDVARMYVALHGDPDDELHVGRKQTLQQAISAVYSEKDAGSLMYDGDLENAMKEVGRVSLPQLECVLTHVCVCPYAFMCVSLRMHACVLTQLLPLIELVFEMPTLRPQRGSQRWIKFMCENLHHPCFRDMAEYPPIFRAAFKVYSNSCNKNGRPKLVNTDMLIWKKYKSPKPKKKGMLSPRTKSAHSYFEFLRGVSVSLCVNVSVPKQLCLCPCSEATCVLMSICVCPYANLSVSSFKCMCVLQVSHNYAINGTRNAGLFPVRVSAEDPDNLTNKTFDNFPKVLFFYYISYCVAECLGTTSKEAREVLLYLTYATPEYKGKQVPCVNIIHRCMQSGTYR